MFTIEQIELAHKDVKSGADFPAYIQEIKQMGVTAFETCVKDSRTKYFGNKDYQIKSQPQYNDLTIADICDKNKFSHYLKIHQKGETDYFTFCKYCAETGIEKWFISLEEMTCTYYDKAGNKNPGRKNSAIKLTATFIYPLPGQMEYCQDLHIYFILFRQTYPK